MRLTLEQLQKLMTVVYQTKCAEIIEEVSKSLTFEGNGVTLNLPDEKIKLMHVSMLAHKNMFDASPVDKELLDIFESEIEKNRKKDKEDESNVVLKISYKKPNKNITFLTRCDHILAESKCVNVMSRCGKIESLEDLVLLIHELESFEYIAKIESVNDLLKPNLVVNHTPVLDTKILAAIENITKELKQKINKRKDDAAEFARKHVKKDLEGIPDCMKDVYGSLLDTFIDEMTKRSKI